ncbi:MAG: hypothetical protein HKP61_08865 [Dactylosporangium sp.]|nr:hypothetical protein [Dactylosporangium sp.]NNJ61046.1 hypothetical protein [Dactylosporangium sp.]
METTYFSIKESILDGRVLRSQDPAGIEQEVYALLTVYQAIIRMAVDAVDTVFDARPDRVSFTAALETAGEQVIAAVGIIIPVGHGLVGAIGQAVLGDLLPGPRTRGKARIRHNPTSKYGPNAGSFPQTRLKYIINTNVMIMEEGLTARSKR